ncbi:hypothetical protein FA95DRAFT_1675823 [Auriscalpium vulgare]|uniref:Uncharacterized protein n=1 Tax=Auriscalpium vulgare TaxID=40419 RepID=A0ACB8S6Y3_9AGAM|nr:hypothetical protein FA95DRAFT_1675823 [Auriscalpium vulgare]
MHTSPNLDLARAQEILDTHLPAPSPRADALADLAVTSTITSRSYLIHSSSTTFLITVSTTKASAASPLPTFAPNPLAAQYALLTHLHTHLPLPHPFPIPTPVACTQTYVLLRLPRIIAADTSLVPALHTPALDTRLGAALRAVHACANDWFGLHGWEHEGVYSWEEAFVRLLEDALAAAPTIHDLEIDPSAIHSHLSRAIGAFLFDDVEEPAFVMVTPGRQHVFVVEGGAGDEPALWLPTLPHALYGDPLLERVFSEVPYPLASEAPAPSAEVLAGYGKALIVFARQHTKRLWYDLYLGLVLLLNAQPEAAGGGAEEEAWARELVARSERLLQGAPCY